jgi:hypothetical protein
MEPRRDPNEEPGLREVPPSNELEREERRLERLRLAVSHWPTPNRFDFDPDPREAA